VTLECPGNVVPIITCQTQAECMSVAKAVYDHEGAKTRAICKVNVWRD
jgi:hypothetical protein